MLYFIPHDEPEDALESNQTVFVWLIRNLSGKSSIIDKTCKDIERKLNNSVCMRVVIGSWNRLTQFTTDIREDVCLLIDNNHTYFSSYRPQYAVIEAKMREAFDMRPTPKPPYRPLTRARSYQLMPSGYTKVSNTPLGHFGISRQSQGILSF